jgi:hypothetical protein
MKLIWISIFFLLLGCASKSTPSSEFWDDACLVTELHPCGKKKLDVAVPFTPEENKILMCRINALVKCRINKRK